MPLEIPKLPVQRLHHRASGSSILGGLPCLLAVVLGLFAHSEALAQRLHTLTLTVVGDDDVTLIDNGDRSGVFSHRVPVANAASSVTVVAEARDDDDWAERVDYAPDATVSDLPVGATVITVTVTRVSTLSDPLPTQMRDYTVTVTRPADTTLRSLTVTFTDGGFLTDEMLEPPEFDSDTRSYAALVEATTTAVTVAVDATSPTAEVVTWDRGPAGSPHVRKLGIGLNTITATVKDGTSTGRYTIKVTKTHPPSAPRTLRATAAKGGEEVALSWTVPSDAGDAPIDRYEVAQYHEFQFTDPNPEDSQLVWVDVGEDRSHRVTNPVGGPRSLYNGRTYYFRVRAYNADNLAGNGSNDAEATPAGPPLEPGTFVATAGNKRVELTWEAPVDYPDYSPGLNDPTPVNPISSYEYSQNGSWRSIPKSGAATTSYPVTGLTNGTTYYFQVRAKNRAGNGLPTEERRVVPGAGAPGVPTGLTAQAGDKEVALSWTAPGDDGGARITGYEYWVGDSGGSSLPNAVWTATPGLGTTFTVTTMDNGDPLMNGDTYYFTVRARTARRRRT